MKQADDLMPLLVNEFKKDDECCLVCGDADYEEDNLIGFCDMCGLSVHRQCYGLDKLDAQTDFKCHNCIAFGDVNASMRVKCILCDQRGGAMMPTGMLMDDFKQFLELTSTAKGFDMSGAAEKIYQIFQGLEKDFQTVIDKEKEHKELVKSNRNLRTTT